jgi:single-strand DNA-binding protein
VASFNKVIIAGTLTRDVELKYTSGGIAIATVSLAINRKWFDKASNEKREEVTYVDCTLWGRTADIAGEYLAKGSSALICGRLKLDSWVDKTTGQKRSKLTVVGEELEMLGSKSAPRREESDVPEDHSAEDSPF